MRTHIPEEKWCYRFSSTHSLWVAPQLGVSLCEPLPHPRWRLAPLTLYRFGVCSHSHYECMCNKILWIVSPQWNACCQGSVIIVEKGVESVILKSGA